MSTPRTVWWLGYWRAGERIYWWTTCISPDAPRDELREHVQALVTPATWETCVDPARTTDRPGEVEAAFVAAGAVDLATVEPHLAALEAGVPVQTDPDLAARQESLERRRKRAADLTSLLGTLPPETRADQSTDLLVETIILNRQSARLRRRAVGDSLARSWSGPLVEPADNRALCTALGKLLVPSVLREYLVVSDPDEPDPATTVVIAPGPDLGRVPWELLTLVDDVRLVERAVLRGGLSPATVADLALPAAPDISDGPGLLVIDPDTAGVPGRAMPIYPHGVPDEWDRTNHRHRTDALVGRRWSTQEDANRSGCTRAELSELLRSRAWGRFVFHGHVTSGDRYSPTAAAIVLQPSTGPGETPMTTSDGRALEGPGHTGDISARVWLHEPTRWPMPRRVAFIACQSDDTGYVEQTGLTLAAANAGARVVITTRWTLPTDSTSQTTDSAPLGPGPTTAIALAVDEALCAPDPVTALRSRQLAELRRWREASTPEQRRRHAPLLWSALVTYVLPATSPSTSLDPDPTPS